MNILRLLALMLTLALPLALWRAGAQPIPGLYVSPMSRGAVAASCTPNTQGGGTFSNVMALWHFDNTGTDNGVAGTHTLTLNGTANYSAVQSKFGGFAYRGGASSSATAAVNSTAMTTDWTFETWYFLSSTQSFFVLISDQGTSGVIFRFNGVATNVIETGNGAGVTKTSSYVPTTSAWIALAWVRASGIHSFYVNGVSQSLIDTDWTTTVGGSSTWVIGNVTTSAGGGYALLNTGFLDEMRISNMARYTGNYTPATLAFCNS